ncbi:MAG: type II toxin-antitoxin system RelE/ParE family toxin [Methylococcales bacterium]|nr:type II toxin-antitoxin system RelE/ParE family toxin [Methylococcales bacterium]
MTGKSNIMAWHIEFKRKAAKALDDLDESTQNKLIQFIEQLQKIENPRSLGKALNGKFKGLWRYRQGNYRIICDIKDDKLVILLLEIGHRSKIYK